jgi:hypothetical protein
MKSKFYNILFTNQLIYPLVVFRILFGLATFISTLRFLILGWVNLHFVNSKVQFKYYGFEWVETLPEPVMFFIHILMLLASLGILFGAFYRISAILFFIFFTYCELIDVTYYLNHYYFVSLIAFLLCLVPANLYYAIDVWLKPQLKQKLVPAWSIYIFKFQLIVVYFFAGIAKINYDWLIAALPLKIWLPANDNLPFIGNWLKYNITAYIFSWAGMLFDISVGYFLLNKTTRLPAWIAIVFFHILTGIMFQIGVFPLVMIVSTILFFDNSTHEKIIKILKLIFTIKSNSKNFKLYYKPAYFNKGLFPSFISVFLIFWVGFHLLFPLRYLTYTGNVFWTEQGYRFSWRVMLMEKAGTATFYVTDSVSNREGVVDNAVFLNSHQEKQMAMQPDLILQYAQFLKNYYANMGLNITKIRADVYVTLNAKPSQLLIDNKLNLLELKDSWKNKNWILPFEKK